MISYNSLNLFAFCYHQKNKIGKVLKKTGLWKDESDISNQSLVKIEIKIERFSRLLQVPHFQKSLRLLP